MLSSYQNMQEIHALRARWKQYASLKDDIAQAEAQLSHMHKKAEQQHEELNCGMAHTAQTIIDSMDQNKDGTVSIGELVRSALQGNGEMALKMADHMITNASVAALCYDDVYKIIQQAVVADDDLMQT